MHEARGIEQDIDLADALGHRLDGGAVAHIEFCHIGHAVLLQQRQLFFVDVGGEYFRALARKGDGAGAADPHRARGHECAFAFQAVWTFISSDCCLSVIPGRA